MIIEDLIEAHLNKRYKRFLADVTMTDGEVETVHCPNPGSMKGCLVPSSRVFIKDSKNPKRKLKYTWTIIELDSTLVVVDTGFANKFVKELVENDKIEELKGYKTVLSEPKYSDGRFDLLLTNNVNSTDGKKPKYTAQPGDCFVEIKSTTLKEGKFAMFPDAKTERGRKHLYKLQDAKNNGIRAVQFFLVNRQDTKEFTPAVDIDPEYSTTLKEVMEDGVESLAFDSDIKMVKNPSDSTYSANIKLRNKLPIVF